jgi:uncharacterized protein (TIGR02118 family)
MRAFGKSLMICRVFCDFSSIKSCSISHTNFNRKVKIKFGFFLLILVLLFGFRPSGSSDKPRLKEGMVKVAILYSNGEGKAFDMDYYEKTHMPMVAGFLGQNLKFYEIDKGIAGRTPTDKVPFLAIGYFYIKDVAEYNKSIAQNREAIINDFKNYTNVQPIVQISEIIQLGN